MGAAFQGELPLNALEKLQPGDVLFVQRFDSWMSWVVMYLTKSEISHVAFYVGNNAVSHATVSGVLTEPIESLYSENTRILPCIWPWPAKARAQILFTMQQNYSNTPYGWGVVAKKAMRIITGRDWRYFRWSFVIDFLLVLLALDIPVFLVAGHLFFSWLILAYLVVVGANWAISRYWPLPFNELTGKPHELLEILLQQDSTLIFDAYQLSKQRDNVDGEAADNA